MVEQGYCPTEEEMAEEFKVWVSIERINENSDSYEDEGLPDPLGRFATLGEAQAFVRSLPGWPTEGGTSDHRETA